MPGVKTGTIFAVYNYKGGVGKTTLTASLASTAAIDGKKVLLVDCDPQCNLSDLLGDDGVQLPRADDEEIEDAAGAAADGNNNQAAGAVVTDGVKKLFTDHTIKPDEAAVDAAAFRKSYTSVYTSNIYTPLKQSFGNPNCPLPDLQHVFRQGSKIPANKLYLLPGSHRLIELEAAFSQAATNKSSGGNVNVLGSFRRLMERLQAEHKFDMIFVDCGPSSGTLNQLIVLSSDYIIPPVYADFFSTTSVYGLLTSVLDRWLSWHRTLVHEQATDPEALGNPYRFKDKPPSILPLLVNNFRVMKTKVKVRGRKRSIVCATKAPSQWMRTLQLVVGMPKSGTLASDAPPENDLFTIPTDVKKIFRPFTDDMGNDTMIVPFIKELAKVNQISMKLKCSAVALERPMIASAQGNMPYDIDGMQAACDYILSRCRCWFIAVENL